MTREEEIKRGAKYNANGTTDDVLAEMYFIRGAEWADEHPKEGLWDSEKVITWIALHAELYGGFNQGKLNSMCEDLSKAIEEIQ